MANVLSNAIIKTIRLGRGGEEKSFHIAFTGTADYISHMGVVALSVRKWNPDMPLSFHFFVNNLSDRERGHLISLSQMILLMTVALPRCFCQTEWLPFSIASSWRLPWPA